MSTALIVVDFQNDFLHGGALAVNEGWDIVPAIAEIIPTVELAVATRDMHPENHCSFSDDPKFEDGSWPPHCVQGTKGSQYPEEMADLILKARRTFIIDKGYEQDQEAYSGFDGVVESAAVSAQEYDNNKIGADYWDLHLTPLLREFEIEKVIVTGLALDYCVRATAIDAAHEGFDVTVPLAATRAVNPETGAKAIEDMTNAGVNVV